MLDEVAAAAAAEVREPSMPEIELGREYMLAVGQPAPDAGHADQYLAHLQSEGLTPMLRQPRGERDFEIVDAAVIGTFGVAAGVGQRDPARASCRLPDHPSRRRAR